MKKLFRASENQRTTGYARGNLLTAIILLASFIFITPSSINAQSNVIDEKFEGKITSVVEEKEVEGFTGKQLQQTLEIKATTGRLKGSKVEVTNNTQSTANSRKYKTGDIVMVSAAKDAQGRDLFYVNDYVRRSPLFMLFAAFVAVALLIGRLKGLTSIVGMGITFFMIFAFILPQILAGYNPVFIAIAASLVIIPVTFFLSHGFNAKTISAVIGTIISLVITGIIATLFVETVKLTGFSQEEASFLQSSQGNINMKGLLLAGIIIGTLGILDDITVSQASVVHQLKKASGSLSLKQLYSRAMEVGRDHIASAINTLVLVYTGAVMPMMLLFVNSSFDFAQVVNYEFVAEEIVRTLVASIGLMLAVPITTFIATFFVGKKRKAS